MSEDEYKVYVRVDKAGRVVDINSSAFLPEPENWYCIDQGVGDRYHHAQGNYLPTPLMDARGVYAWKLADGQVVRRTQAEMDEDAEAQAHMVQETLSARLDEVEAALMELAAMTAEE